ncbi:MAG TPA: PaaI family thioesterase [Geobacteraceae bacterium]|nr:PaaI family thioesterase [Geobacteraceae bacterium]
MLNRIREMIDIGKPFMPFAALLGLSVKWVGVGQADIELEINEHHLNTMGTVHGGVLCSIADTAMGVAFATMLEENETLATQSLRIDYLKPVWKGKLLVVSKVVKKGKITGFVECDILDENKQLIARAGSTYMSLAGNQAKNRALLMSWQQPDGTMEPMSIAEKGGDVQL